VYFALGVYFAFCAIAIICSLQVADTQTWYNDVYYWTLLDEA